jgi:hypothetical protein
MPDYGEFKAPRSFGSGSRERGRRRTRQDQISLRLKTAGEIADHWIRTERRKLVSSAGSFFERANSPE